MKWWMLQFLYEKQFVFHDQNVTELGPKVSKELFVLEPQDNIWLELKQMIFFSKWFFFL